MKWWTKEEDDVLRRIVSDGLPIKNHIHEIPGRTVSAAYDRVSRLGIRSEISSGQGYREYECRAQPVGILVPEIPDGITAHMWTEGWWRQNQNNFISAMLKHHPEREARL